MFEYTQFSMIIVLKNCRHTKCVQDSSAKISILFVFFIGLTAGTCTFPSDLQGTWTSSNFGTITIGSGYLHMTRVLITSVTTGTNFTCDLYSGTQYVLKSVSSFKLVSTSSALFRAYMCFDVRKVTSYSYYFYQQSDESIFLGERVIIFDDGSIVTSVSSVCTTTVQLSQYHVMVKNGFAKNAYITCPDMFLGVFYYTYNNTAGSHCSGISQLDVCSYNKSLMVFNKTLCSTNVAFSTGGVVSCLVSVVNGTTTYLTTYNYDSAIDGVTNYQFSCFAATTVGTNVIATVKATECDSNQSPTTIPSGGGIFKFTANSLPQEESKKQSSDYYKWIIVGSVLGFVILVALAIFLMYCCCSWWPKSKRNRRIRTKIQLWKFEHPMAEASMSIDAPSTMMPVFDPYESMAEQATTDKDQNPNATLAGTFNPLRESSMILNLKEEARRARIRVKNKNLRSDSHLANGGPFGPRGAILAHLEAGSVLGSSLEDTMLSDRLFSSPSNSVVNSTPGLSAIAMQIPEQVPEQIPEPPPVNSQDLRGEIPPKNAMDKRSFFEYRPKSKTTLEPKKNQVNSVEPEHYNHTLLGSANPGQNKVDKTSSPRGKGSASISSQNKSPMGVITESKNMPRTSTRNSFRQSELNMSRVSSAVGRERLRMSTKDDPSNAKGSELSAASSFSETDNINERKSSVVSAGSKLSNYFSKSMARLTHKRVRLNRLDVT